MSEDNPVEKRECFDLRQLCRSDILELKTDQGMIEGKLSIIVETLNTTATIVQKNTETISQVIASQAAIVERQNKTEIWMQGEITAGRKGLKTTTDKLLTYVMLILLALLGLKELAGVPL